MADRNSVIDSLHQCFIDLRAESLEISNYNSDERMQLKQAAFLVRERVTVLRTKEFDRNTNNYIEANQNLTAVNENLQSALDKIEDIESLISSVNSMLSAVDGLISFATDIVL